MRVISGMSRGLKLDSPEGLDTRPTLDRVKEALFSMLFDKVTDADVLDLFAGSGALGIEALSRYANSSTFVDMNPKAVEVVKSNLKKTPFSDRAKVFLSDAVIFLRKACSQYDIIFLDPPYAAGLYEEVFKIIKEKNLLKKEGLIVAECDTSHSFSVSGFNIIKEKNYGKVKLYVLEEPEHEKSSSVSR